MVKYIASKIANKIIKDSDNKNVELVVGLSGDVFSIFDLYRNFSTYMVKYVALFSILWLTLLVILPATIFFFFTFWLSVLVFLLGSTLGVYSTFKFIRTVPIEVYNQILNRVENVQETFKGRV